MFFCHIKLIVSGLGIIEELFPELCQFDAFSRAPENRLAYFLFQALHGLGDVGLRGVQLRDYLIKGFHCAAAAIDVQ